MKIEKTLNGDTLTVRPEGRLDTMTAPELESELKASLDGVKKLVFDLDALEYISSAGLRVLLGAQKIIGETGSMVVRKPSEIIAEVFEVTGFSDILTIE